MPTPSPNDAAALVLAGKCLQIARELSNLDHSAVRGVYYDGTYRIEASAFRQLVYVAQRNSDGTLTCVLAVDETVVGTYRSGAWEAAMDAIYTTALNVKESRLLATTLDTSLTRFVAVGAASPDGSFVPPSGVSVMGGS